MLHIFCNFDFNLNMTLVIEYLNMSIQEREQNLERLGNEPSQGADIVTVSFVMSDADDILTRRFHNDTKIMVIIKY